MYSDHNLPWVDSPFFEKELNASDLSESDKQFIKDYAEHGYVVIDPGLDETVIDTIVSTMKPEFEKLKGEDKRIQDAWKFNEHVRKVAILEVVMDKLRLLYRREPIPFQTLSFPVGTQQKTHSDMIHFNSIPARFMCGVWIAYEDISDDNGPLHYYPGSHKLPFYDMIDMGVEASKNVEAKKTMMAYAENYEVFIEEMVQALGLKKATLNIKKGQAMIWAANLLHGGEKILRPGATRHSQVTHYYFEDCMYYAPRYSDIAIKRIFLSDLINIKTGEKLKSTYFGQTIKPDTKLYLQQQTIKQLSKISHLFPKSIVDNVKTFIRRSW